MMAVIIVSIFVFGLVYPIALYPVLLIILSKLFNRKIKTKCTEVPDINVVIAAYNEEKYIGRAIESIIACEYPKEKLHIIVGSDGSSDSTVKVAEEFKSALPQLQVFDFERMGKNNVLNAVAKYLNCDIVFFMDADFRLHRDTFKRSIKYFADENVGGVMSKLHIVVLEDGKETAAKGEGAYQKFERYLKKLESKIWTTVNNFGFYGVRRSCLKQIPNMNVCDDMYNVLNVSAQGKRMIFADESEVDEVREKSVGEELRRRVRLSSGGLSTSFAVAKLFNPFKGWASFFFVSHKFSRFFFPICMLGIMFLTPFVYSANEVFYWFLVICQILFYGAASTGLLLSKFGVNIKVFSFPYFFFVLNCGVLFGIFRFLSGKQNSVWERIDTRKTAVRR